MSLFQAPGLPEILTFAHMNAEESEGREASDVFSFVMILIIVLRILCRLFT